MQKKYNIHLIAAARPNFMKIAPLYHHLQKENWCSIKIVHTGQHYDANMSESFFRDLKLPLADFNLGVGSGSHAEQTAKVMIAYEQLCLEDRPDLVVVVGDVNSTVACALVTAKLQIATAHLEAGLRSFDRSMPEEINRIVTDALADLLWTHSPEADQNLLREGVAPSKIKRVGNIMIDSLELLRTAIESKETYLNMNFEQGTYGIVTLHRPSNVDDPEVLQELCGILEHAVKIVPFIFSVHPRTRKNLEVSGLLSRLRSLHGLSILDPLPYLDFMNLLFHSALAVTDSGGIQEETTYLGIPCVTLRQNTERPVTITEGTNSLSDLSSLLENIKEAVELEKFNHRVPEFWDGKTAARVVDSISDFLGEKK